MFLLLLQMRTVHGDQGKQILCCYLGHSQVVEHMRHDTTLLFFGLSVPYFPNPNALLSGVVKLADFVRVFAQKVTALPRPMQQLVRSFFAHYLPTGIW